LCLVLLHAVVVRVRLYLRSRSLKREVQEIRMTTITAPRPKVRPSAKTTPTAKAPTREQIQKRAYEIYVARNGSPGSPESDWRQAENELLSRMLLLGR
jgi:hypothetical protein